MSNKKLPPVEHQFKPGVSGNPSGRPKLTEDEKRLRKLTKEQFKEIGDIIVSGNTSELDELIHDPKATVLQVAIATAMRAAIEKGDLGNVEILLNRLIGKPKEELEVTGITPTVIKLSNGEELVLGTKKEETE